MKAAKVEKRYQSEIGYLLERMREMNEEINQMKSREEEKDNERKEEKESEEGERQSLEVKLSKAREENQRLREQLKSQGV